MNECVHQNDRCLLRDSKREGILGDAKGGTHFLMIIEMVFYSFDFLIRFVSLASYEDDIACLCQSCCCANGFATICNGKRLGTSCFV